MGEADQLYRLNGIAHIAGYIDKEPTRCISSVRRQQNMKLHDRVIPYLKVAGLEQVARLNAHWFKLDEPLISAFVERWRPETHTFHMPFGECTVTLQDVSYQLGLPIDGEAVSGCLSDFEQLMEGGKPSWTWFQELFGELPPVKCINKFTVTYKWFQTRFEVLPDNASEDTVRMYARAYIMVLLSSQLFGDKSGTRVHIRWLPFVARLEELGRYSWGSSTLAWLYRCLCRVANRNVVKLAGPLTLLQSWIFWRFPTLRPHGFNTFTWPLASRWAKYIPSLDQRSPRVLQLRLKLDKLRPDDFLWIPYAVPDVLEIAAGDALDQRHQVLWRSTTSLIYFAVIEWHQVDRVLPQLGGVQHRPHKALDIDSLMAKDGRGGDRWFPNVFATWHQHWNNRFDNVLRFQIVPNPGPSVDYLNWWFRIARRFLSPEHLLVDPRVAGIPQDARPRGERAAPAMVEAPDVPDRRSIERRARVGTRTSQRNYGGRQPRRGRGGGRVGRRGELGSNEGRGDGGGGGSGSGGTPIVRSTSVKGIDGSTKTAIGPCYKKMVRFIKTHGRPSSITGLFNNRYYGVNGHSNFELESLQEHNLGSDVPLRNPDRSVSSFAMNLKYAKAPEALTTTDQLHSEAYPHDVEEASAECNDMEFKNLRSTFKELGLCMMEVGLCLARICDKAIGSNELEQSLLESCAAKGRLIHYHSRLDSFLLKGVEKTGAAGKRKAKNNKRDQGSCVMNVQKSLQGSSESNSIARDDHNSCGIHSNLWQQWHYDYGIFTVLTAPFFLCCLQIYDPNKKRIFMVKAPPDSFIIQVGESADIISKGKLRATLHAVHRPVKFNNLSRETFVVFLQPAWTKTLSTADYSHAKLMKEYNDDDDDDDEQVGEDRYKQLSYEFKKIVPPLSSRLKDGMTFAEFSRETTKQYYGGSGLQSNK
ncbi:hypothetical protein AHAS_Ahas12G0069200 [Arachis hypogaea]